MTRRITGILLILVMMCAMLVSCGPKPAPSPAPDPDPTPAPAPTPDPPAGKTLKASEQPVELVFRTHNLLTVFGFIGELDLDEIELKKEQEDSTKAEFEFEGIHRGENYLSVDVEISMGTIGEVLDLDIPEDTDHSGYLPSLVDQMGIFGDRIVYELEEIPVTGSSYKWLRCCVLDDEGNPMKLVYRAVTSLDATAVFVEVEIVCMGEKEEERILALAEKTEEWLKLFRADAKADTAVGGLLPAIKGKTLSGLPTDTVDAYALYYECIFDDYRFTGYSGNNTFRGALYTVDKDSVGEVKAEVEKEWADQGDTLEGSSGTLKGRYDWLVTGCVNSDNKFIAQTDGNGTMLLFAGLASGPDIAPGKAAEIWLKDIALE